MRHIKICAFAITLTSLCTACFAATEGGSSWAEVNYSSGWGPCPPNRICFSNWHVDRATKVVLRTGSSGQSSRKLDEQELAQLEKLTSQAKLAASKCPDPPTDVFDDLEIVYKDQSKFSKSVTGCAYDQGVNSVKSLKEWLSK